MEVVQAIEAVRTDESDKPLMDVKMLNIKVLESVEAKV